MPDSPRRPPFRIGGLGEIAIRCAEMGPMVAFYEDVIGLERLTGNASSQIVFFRLAPGYRGHTQVLALFAKAYAPRPDLHPVSETAPVTGAASALHHIALSLPHADQEAAIAWLEAHGLPCRVEHFDWIGWRGVFTADPEGNTVELVAFDPGWSGPQIGT